MIMARQRIPCIPSCLVKILTMIVVTETGHAPMIGLSLAQNSVYQFDKLIRHFSLCQGNGFPGLKC